MPQQEALTIIARVDPQRLSALEPVLEEMRCDPGNNRVLPFAKLPGCHFGRVLFMPPSTDLDGRAIAPQILMLSDCDGSARAQLAAVVDVAGEGLDRLFGQCEGYPPAPASRSARMAFLRGKRRRVPASYVHRPGRTVEQIRGEDRLRAALEGLLGKAGTGETSAAEVCRRIRAFVEKDPELRWALAPAPGLPLGFRVRNALHFAALPLGLLAFGPVVVPAALLALVLVRLQELRDHPEHVRPSPEHMRALTALEDKGAHNAYTAGGYVKPGWLRQALIRSLLPVVGWGTRHLYARDSLAGVKTIHFARWIPLDEARRVVFVSNYDGSVEGYNDDFIDLIAWGLNLVFSNGQGYPRTRWLVFEGARREQEFKDYLRCHQIPTPIWYSAYPHLTALEVERNAKLRAGLRARMSEREAQQWLRLL